MTSNHKSPEAGHGQAALTLAALGVVFGDIGTSPLYALKACFNDPNAVPVTPENVLGVLSFVFWALVLVIGVKYVAAIMRADNRGEGGLFALMALLPREKFSPKAWKRLVLVGLFGAALLYGDGVITPVISVLSAVEGLKVATTKADPLVLPITVAILVLLFFMQRHGTGRIGRVLGPFMVLWFVLLALLGGMAISRNPSVLAALNPWHAVGFLFTNLRLSAIVLCAAVLCVTGGEALYADMGHFGRKPISRAWFFFVFPALVLNYFGQGALLLDSPKAVSNPFFLIVPSWMFIPMVAMATGASAIASQAIITGVFSLTRQAVQLGYCPRLRIVHTSGSTEGQIYVPLVNWLMMIMCLAIVFGFGESEKLAGAYGLAVTGTMAATTILFYAYLRKVKNVPLLAGASLCAVFLAFDLAFFGANLIKIPDGGWLPMAVAMAVILSMTTWREGRELVKERLGESRPSLDELLKMLEDKGTARVPGTAVFLTRSRTSLPVTLFHHVNLANALHRNVIFFSVVTEAVPVVRPPDDLEVEDLGHGFHRLVGHVGFMQAPDVRLMLAEAQVRGVCVTPGNVTYFMGKVRPMFTRGPGMSTWRKILFILQTRNARDQVYYLNVPIDRVVEVGVRVEL